MADGSSGLSLSEMGISTVKKTQKVVQQFAQGAAAQITGQQQGTNQGQVPQSGEFIPQAPKLPTAEMPDEAGPGGQVHDLFTAGSHASSSSNSQGGTLFTSPAAQPPDEAGPKSGSFDLGSIFGEKNPLGKTPMDQNISATGQLTSEQKMSFANNKAAEEKQIEALRQKLFSEYKDDFIAKAEGKNQKKEETVQEKLQREEKEQREKEQREEAEEAKMAPVDTGSGTSKMPGLFKKQKRKSIFDVLRKPKQGSKEGKLGKG